MSLTHPYFSFFKGQGKGKCLNSFDLTVEFSFLSQEKMSCLLKTWNLEQHSNFIYENEIVYLVPEQDFQSSSLFLTYFVNNLFGFPSQVGGRTGTRM